MNRCTRYSALGGLRQGHCRFEDQKAVGWVESSRPTDSLTENRIGGPRKASTTPYVKKAILLALLAGLLTGRIVGEELPQRIDALIRAVEPGIPAGEVCDDAAFVRRIYLDLAGRIPTHGEASRFLADAAADKRSKLIDGLLAGPEYPARMHDLFHAMLMERRGDHAEWSTFLKTSFAANKPWDQLVREILDPDPSQESLRGAAFFHTRRLEKVGQQETDYPGLTRDVARLFLGMDLQCAQCHNHLQIAAYQQADFQGLFIVFQNSFIRSDVKFPAVGEKVLTKKLDFMSVFEKVPMATAPRVPGRPEIEIALFEKGQEFLMPPDPKANFLGTPKFRALQAVAKELPIAENRAFVVNIANRLWFVMLGQGLVNPLDQIHSGNAPTHPAVLDLLCEELIARKFDLKSVLRDLALTETYQRTSVVPEGTERPALPSYRLSREKRLSAEQLMQSLLAATGPREQTAPLALPPNADGTPADPEKFRAAFVKAFGNVPQDPEIEFSPSLKSSLFVMNDSLVLNCLNARPDNLLDRLSKLTAASEVADELSLCLLARKPTAEEQALVAEYLAKNPERRSAALTNLAWALLASTEFCLNH